MKAIQAYVAEQFEAADQNHDGVIDQDEFTLYYFRCARSWLCWLQPFGCV